MIEDIIAAIIVLDIIWLIEYERLARRRKERVREKVREKEGERERGGRKFGWRGR